MKALLVDDNDSVRLTTAAILEDAGHEIVEAASLSEARSRLAETRFDLVILDLHLGDGEGTELLPELRRDQPTAGIVILSGSAAEPIAGADLVLEKALAPDELVRRLERLSAR